jgi:HNH endonuclease
MAPIDSDESICIYCKKAGSSREHVAPSSLGGNCTIACVCRTCNGDLSVVDQALAENSPVALSKITHTPVAAFKTQLGGYASYQEPGGLDVGVRIGNQARPEVRPQLYLMDNQIRAIASGREGLNDLIAFIEKRIQKKNLADVRIVAAESPQPRLLMHRSDDAYISCSDPKLSRDFLNLLEAQWPEIKLNLQTVAETRVTKIEPEIDLKLKFRPNDEFRGVAKIAFETVALMLGPQYLLSSEFDPIRAYIMGDVRLPDPIPPGDVAVDSRFVTRLGVEFKMNFTEQHGVLLYCSPPDLMGFVLLYGENAYMVRLATMAHETQWLRCYEFSYSKDGHREISEDQFADRLLKIAPELFNLNPGDLPDILQGG